MRHALRALFVIVCLTVVTVMAASTHETITVSGTAAGLAAATKKTTAGSVVTYCVGRVEGASVRYWTDGTAPTASTGIPLNPNDTFELFGGEIPGFQVILQTASVATINVECGTR